MDYEMKKFAAKQTVASSALEGLYSSQEEQNAEEQLLLKLLEGDITESEYDRITREECGIYGG